MVVSVPVQDKFALSLGGGQTMTLTQAMVLLTLGAWFINRCAFKKPFVTTPTPPILKWFLIYIGAMIISLLTAFNIGDGLNEISRWLITFFAYLLATSVIETRTQFWWLVVSLLVGSVFEAGLGIVQTGLGLGPQSFAINDDLSRAFGTFGFPNPYAGYLEMCLPLMLALGFLGFKLRGQSMRAWLSKEGQPRPTERKMVIRSYLLLLFTWPFAGFILLAVVASYSRGAWLGLIVGAVAMVAVRGRKSAGLWLAIVALVILGYLGISTGAVSPTIATRLTSITEQFTPFDVRDVVPTSENFAVVERMAMWQAGGNMFLYNPWLGVGVGNFNTVYNMFNAPQWIYSRGHAHNYYIHAAAETGVVGLGAYLLLILAIFRTGWQAVRRTRDQSLRYVAWGAFGIIAAVMFHNIVEDLHVLNLGIHWCSIIALFYLAGKFDKADSQKVLY
jgi:O-antigen ligase